MIQNNAGDFDSIPKLKPGFDAEYGDADLGAIERGPVVGG